MPLTDPSVIQQQLASIRWRALRGKHFGQHFLTCRDALTRIVEALEISAADTVVEVGPGLGVLTVELAKRAKRVIAVEKDAAIIPVLRQNLREFPNVEIIHSDALSIDPKNYSITQLPNYLLTGNLPYAITLPVIERFILGCPLAPSRAVFLIQKEVGQRLTDPPGGSARSAVTVLLEEASKSELIASVPRQAFFPIPEVDGAIIRIVPTHDSQSEIRNPQFRNFIFAVFRHRRKQIGGTLPRILGAPSATVLGKLSFFGINPHARPQELALSQWRSLFEHFML